MTMTDPIADLLTRIRNANTRGKDSVDIPLSRLKREIVRVLKEEKFIRDFAVLEDGPQGTIRVYLRYGPAKARIIQGLQRVSRPGRRLYGRMSELPRPQGGLGVAIISTSRGVMTDRQARAAGQGGEVLCYVW
jgi:small subunit ribosomal protein S8